MASILSLCLTAFLVLGCFPETTCATLRSRTTRGDDGDDGGAGGMAGALAGMFGGGGDGDGSGGDDNDEDPNMVGGKHHGKKSGNGGVDLGGLENSLKTGGVGGLMGMLTAMRAAHGGGDTHIKKGPNGEEMYDFRDLDDGFTTPEPVEVTMAPMPISQIINPQANYKPVVEVPSAPTIALPEKGGKLKGVRTITHKYDSKPSKPSNPGMVVWGSKNSDTTPVQAAQPVQPVAVAQPLPVSAPVVQLATGSIPAGSSLYQGLAMLRQNVDVLMSETAVNGQGSSGATAAQLEQLSQNFTAAEQKMEKRLDDQAQEMKTLEQENAEMKKQLEEQAQEMKDGEQGHAKVQKAVKQEATDQPKPQAKVVQKVKSTKVKAQKEPTKQLRGQAAAAAAPKPQVAVIPPKPKAAVKAAVAMAKVAYATSPWEATFKVHLDGKAGGKEQSFTVRVHPEWAPEGAKRFQDILQAGILDDTRFFRVMHNFMVQFGIPGAPEVAAKWVKKRIPDDPVTKSNFRGMMSFATSGKNTRTTQMFINYGNNQFLDSQGFAPFAEVIGDGMKVVDRIQSKYKELPNQGKIQHHGNKYLLKHFPDLSFIGHVDSSLANSASFIQHNEGQAKPQQAAASNDDSEVQHSKKKASEEAPSKVIALPQKEAESSVPPEIERITQIQKVETKREDDEEEDDDDGDDE